MSSFSRSKYTIHGVDVGDNFVSVTYIYHDPRYFDTEHDTSRDKVAEKVTYTVVDGALRETCRTRGTYVPQHTIVVPSKLEWR